MRKLRIGALVALGLLGACGEQAAVQVPEGRRQGAPADAAALATEPVLVAFLGDYGVASKAAGAAVQVLMAGTQHDPRAEGDVAALLHRMRPQVVFTTGDNNYPAGEASTLDDNIGQFYSDFMAPYRGRFGVGARVNRFFPALGNHDWETPGAAPYLTYFSLPNNGRYYDVELGLVHVFVIDSDEREPDGVEVDSRQYAWFKDRIKRSTARFKVVTLHHPPYNSSHHQDPRLRWPFAKWGVDAVIAGHHHAYERFERDGIAYVVNGTGGAPLSKFSCTEAGSAVQYRDDYGALFLSATHDALQWQFINRHDRVVDSWTQ